MNKKLKFIVAGVAIVAGLASAVSCQDLSKDVEDLGKRVSTLENTVKDLQTKIDAGAVITSVTSTATGVKVTLSNGNSFDLTNGKDGANGTNGTNGKDGKDGAPGTVITIGENGNWFLDGVDTGMAVAGKDGAAGKDGDSIVWAIEDGKFVEYKNGVATGNTKEIAGEGVLKAVWDAENGVLTLYGAEGTEEGLPIVLTNSAAAPAAISLVDAFSGNVLVAGPTQGQSLNWSNPVILRFSNVIEKANVFEEKIQNAITFEEGKQTPVGATLIVRVSPANYELKAEDITFVNSVGIAFDAIKAVEVAPYEGLLTKSLANTGLWAVEVELESYDKEEFDYYTWLDVDNDGVFTPAYTAAGVDKYIAYAIKAQEAVSTYDLAFDYFDFVPLNLLDFYVGANVPTANWIGTLTNRYQNTYAAGANKSLKQPGTTTYQELTWAAPTAKIPTPDVEPVLTGTKKNVAVDATDDRGSAALYDTYKAVLGEPINIYAGWIGVTPGGPVFNAYNQIKAIYVTLDKEENAIESAPSEWNAWKSYEDGIEGLNEVQLGQIATITINKKSADGDIIGFRVYAVNLDGTLVDPDGRAFYVQVGKAGDELDVVNTVMNTIEQYQTTPNPKSGVANTSIKKIYADHWDFVMLDNELVDGSAFVGTFHLMDKTNADVVTGVAPMSGSATGLNIDLSTITKAQFEATAPLFLYEDDKTYHGVFTFYNADNFVVATLPVTFTKSLPASIAQVPVKTSQLGADGKYRCFLIPTTWAAYADVATATAAGQKGNMDMLSIFNFPKDDPTGYEVTFAASKKAVVSGKNVLQDITVKPDTPLASDNLNNPATAPNNWITIVDLDLIDNKTEHKTTVIYNMGPVSSAKIKWNTTTTPVTITSVDNYVLNAGEFQTIFFCIYNEDANYGWPWSWDSSAAWANTDAVAGSAKIAKGKNLFSVVYEDYSGGKLPASKVIGGSKWDSIYKGAMPTGYKNTINVTDVKLVTKGGANDGKVEYYDVKVNGTNFEFTKKSGATNPTSAVPSELVITYTDMYGHKNVCKVPAEVLKR
jgi:outer membrane murein-binding lipoprotein Lpp